MNLLTILLFLYIITKPFYFWASGLPQISDFILVLAFIVTFLSYRPKEITKIIKENIYFFIFLLFVIVINLIYSIYYYDLNFDLKTLYYIFDALGIITFSIVFSKNNNAKNTIRVSFMFAILTQLLLFILRFGRYYSGVRYMGTFNDPNQFAFFCLLSYCFVYLLEQKENKLTFINISFLLITLFLILQSASTGMLLGIGIFIVLLAISVIRKGIKDIKKYSAYIFTTIIFSVLAVSIFSLIPSTATMIEKVANSQIISRVEEKTAKASGEGESGLWEERGYDRIIYYPQYLLFGAGEGQYNRFKKAYYQGELHATLPSILFCYGIVPLYFLVKWMIKKLKGIKIETACIYVALILESFTLINSRQVLFWVIFALGEFIVGSRNK